jgi:hypothetical protein
MAVIIDEEDRQPKSDMAEMLMLHHQYGHIEIRDEPSVNSIRVRVTLRSPVNLIKLKLGPAGQSRPPPPYSGVYGSDYNPLIARPSYGKFRRTDGDCFGGSVIGSESQPSPFSNLNEKK